MKRLVIATLVVALSLVGMTGCGMCLSDEGEDWTARDEGLFSGGDSHMHVDPEIEARAEMY